MKKLFLFIALLTLSAGLWAQDNWEMTKEEAIEIVNKTADEAITEIQNASTEAVAKPIQDKAIVEINKERDEDLRDIGRGTEDERYCFSCVCNVAIHTITKIKVQALEDIKAAIEQQNATTQVVSYYYPVYNTDGVAASGIKEWKKASVEATKVKSSNSRITWNAGWYVVTGEVTLAQGVDCTGAVHLILANGAKLTAEAWADDYWQVHAPIQVSEPNYSITIYAQSTDSTQMGQLLTSPMEIVAGIGGGDYSSGYNVTINGGRIIANGGNKAAGIGGGASGLGSNITINGGIVTARGGRNAAGIGGGNCNVGSDITINGGIVTARGGRNAAGIGGGNCNVGSDITINGGIVTALGGNAAAGIGGGKERGATNITINGGKIMAKGGDEDAGYSVGDAIGDGAGAPPSLKIHASSNLVVKAGTTANPETEIAPERTAETDIASDLAGKQYATVETKPITTTYIDENGISQEATAWEVVFNSVPAIWGEAGQTTWYIVQGPNVRLLAGAVCKGDVRLILADDAVLTATGLGIYHNTPGIQVQGNGNSLTIYGQTDQSGQLTAEGGDLAAAIGGERMGTGSNITINGGIITAKGGNQAAGIGGGIVGNGSNITINGGEITATGHQSAAGIGGGYYGTGSNITINGGKITAKGNIGCAGIGNGVDARTAASNIFVATTLTVRADDIFPPTTVIANDGSDLASSLTKKLFVIIESEPSTGLFDVNDNDNSKFLIQNSKFIKDGQLFIRKNGKTYNALGIEL